MENQVNKSATGTTTENRWFAVVGNNGMCITQQEFRLVEAIRVLKMVALMEFGTEGAARAYVYAAYNGRFVMRNNHLGIAPQMPVHLPVECLWVDPDFEAREGECEGAGYFPGIPV